MTDDIDAHPYTAYRNEHGVIVLWDDEESIMSLPEAFPVDLVRPVAQAYAKGEAAGRHAGAVDKAFEIRKALFL